MRAAAPIIPKIPKVFPPFIAFAPPVYTECDAEADPLALLELEADSELDAGPELDAAGAVIFVSCAPSLQVGIFLTSRGRCWSRRDCTGSAGARARARRPSG